MINELWQHSTTARDLIAQGRREEALRMARVALERRFGGLEQNLALGLSQMDLPSLEAIAFGTLSIEALQARLGHQPEGSTSPRMRGISDRHGKPVRVAPLGGYRNS